MIDKILPLLNRLIPSSLAIKGLQKLDPRMGKFLDHATSIYGADAAINFLRDELSPPSPDNTLRLDEQAAQQRKRQSDLPLRALGTLAKAGGALALGGLGGGALSAADSLQGELLPPEQEQQQQQMKGLPYNQQRALPGRGEAGYEQQASVPNEAVEMGYNRSPDFVKREAYKKYLQHKNESEKKKNPEKKSFMQDIGDRFENQYGKMEEDNIDDALLAALNKILKM